MPEHNEPDSTQFKEIQEYLQSIERRLSILEEEVGISPGRMRRSLNGTTSDAEGKDTASKPGSRRFESGFGESGLAWIGSIILLFGITIMMQFIQAKGFNLVSILFGYIMAGIIFGLSYYFRRIYSFLAKAFRLSSAILLYFTTLRLHFFLDEPLLSSKVATVMLLILVTALILVSAARNRNKTFTVLGIIMSCTTAVLADTTIISLPLLVLSSMYAILLYFREGWWKILLFSMVVVYITFLLWFLNNPIMGNPMAFISAHENGLVYLYLIGFSYSMVAIESGRAKTSEQIAISGILVNGIFFSTLLVLFVLNFYADNYILLLSLVSLLGLAYSAILKSVTKWKVTSAFFALYGFMALSITVYGIYGFPRVYWLLALQSLLVLSMALWFRNKVIVILNAALFTGLYLVYLFSSEPLSEVNYAFALVALVTARVLNWKKDRLEIRTEVLRNTYLISAFFMVLIALYHSLPVHLITLSWSLAAIAYFLLSLVLRNVKYRYMALGTLLAAAFHLFIVDLARIDILYRVIAFFFLSIIFIAISIYYARGAKRSANEKSEAGEQSNMEKQA